MSADVTSRSYGLAGAAMIVLSLVLVFVFGFPLILGFAPLVVGLGILAAPLIINGLPSLVQKVWRSAEPEWDEEILHTDGNDSRIRYGFESTGSPWFVARDICAAIGEKMPDKRATRWGGVGLVMRNEVCCFGEEAVKKYLARLSISNNDAKRLLVLMQNEILRKVEKERELKKRLG